MSQFNVGDKFSGKRSASIYTVTNVGRDTVVLLSRETRVTHTVSTRKLEIAVREGWFIPLRTVQITMTRKGDRT